MGRHQQRVKVSWVVVCFYVANRNMAFVWQLKHLVYMGCGSVGRLSKNVNGSMVGRKVCGSPFMRKLKAL
uniref:Uncharacterized protein n=1 Tax=Cucumis melo TaxID=3656 RepID=A0A9I9D1M8_CUCME